MWLNLSFWYVFGTSVFLGTLLLFAEDRVWKVKDKSESQHVSVSEAVLDGDTVAVVKFCERTVEPEDELKYSQKSHVLIRKFGEKYTKMVLSVHKAKGEPFRLTRYAIFLQAVADENKIREREELKPIKVLLHIPFKSVNCRNSLSEIRKSIVVAIRSYFKYPGVIFGVILEASLIQTPLSVETVLCEKEMNTNISTEVVEFKKLFNSIQLMYGYELKMGLAVNSYKECITSLASDLSEVISSFDMVVLNMSLMEYSGASCQEIEEQDEA